MAVFLVPCLLQCWVMDNRRFHHDPVAIRTSLSRRRWFSFSSGGGERKGKGMSISDHWRISLPRRHRCLRSPFGDATKGVIVRQRWCWLGPRQSARRRRSGTGRTHRSGSRSRAGDLLPTAHVWSRCRGRRGGFAIQLSRKRRRRWLGGTRFPLIHHPHFRCHRRCRRRRRWRWRLLPLTDSERASRFYLGRRCGGDCRPPWRGGW